MNPPRYAPMRPREHGFVLVLVLVLMAAGMALAAAVANSAMLELAMTGRSLMRLRALEAAEAGLVTAMRARGWSASENWSATGTLAEQDRWRAEVRLVAARIDTAQAIVEWHFEIESEGRAGHAAVKLLQGFSVHGALPGEPRYRWWRHGEAPP